MGTTPGQASLHLVSREIDKVASLCEEMRLSSVRPLACRKEVLSALMDCSIFHFAGHGHNNASNPLKSALLLSDGPLVVENLFDVNLRARKPFLAYLSACGTGQIRYDETINEGLHLINAYQVAGFRHVIGSLCEVEDTLCVQFAEETYQWIRTHGISDRYVCEGLHHASRKLRDQSVATNSVVRSAKREERRLESVTDLEAGSLRDSSGEVDMRDPRTVVSCDYDVLPAHWAPYVHFGA